MEAPKQAIEFGNVFVDNATRVDYSNEDALQGFNVYGTVTGTAGTVALFNGDGATVTRNGAAYGAAWTCSESEYWIPGAAYKFAAVVDATASVEGGLPKTLTTVADDATTGNMNLKDMLYAEASVASAVAEQGIVNFTFSHLLSKVKFTVKSNTEGDYYHTVTGIKVSNFKTGTYTIANETWTASSANDNKKEVEFAEIANVTKATGAKSNADMLFVPTTGSYTVTFTVNIYKGDKLFGTETINKTVETDLLKGNAYNFTIACSVGKPIEFNVANDPTWTTQPDVTIQ